MGRADKTFSDLTKNQKKFVTEYLENAKKGEYNSFKAAKVAYPNCSNQTLFSLSHKLYHHPAINRILTEALFEDRMPPTEIWKRWSDMARVDVDDFMTVLPDGTPIFDYSKAQMMGVTHLIKKFKVNTTIDEDGNTKTYWTDVEFHDSQAALKELGRLHKMIENKWIGMNLNLSKMPAEALEALAAGEDVMTVLIDIMNQQGESNS